MTQPDLDSTILAQCSRALVGALVRIRCAPRPSMAMPATLAQPPTSCHTPLVVKAPVLCSALRMEQGPGAWRVCRFASC